MYFFGETFFVSCGRDTYGVLFDVEAFECHPELGVCKDHVDHIDEIVRQVAGLEGIFITGILCQHISFF